MSRTCVRLLIPTYVMLIASVPSVLAMWPLLAVSSRVARMILIAVAPLSYGLYYVLTAGLLARFTISKVVPGRFKRDLGDVTYGPRRLYGVCWTAIYYFGPLYHAVLSFQPLKRLTLRLFGYRGSLDVTFYPDTWIRDLPLLDLAPGAYLSNKATIGTNMCLASGDILVDSVRIGRGSLIGHLTMLAPGVAIGDGVEIGAGSRVGVGSRVGDRSTVGPCCIIHHRVTIGQRCQIGLGSTIGAKAVLADGISIPIGSMVPARSRIVTQADVVRSCRGGRHRRLPNAAMRTSIAGSGVPVP